ELARGHGFLFGFAGRQFRAGAAFRNRLRCPRYGSGRALLRPGPHEFVNKTTSAQGVTGDVKRTIVLLSCPGRVAAPLRAAPQSRDPSRHRGWTPDSAAHHAARHSASKRRVNALMAL